MLWPKTQGFWFMGMEYSLEPATCNSYPSTSDTKHLEPTSEGLVTAPN